MSSLSLCFPVTLHCCYQITPEKRAKKKRLASISTELANVNVTQGAVTEIGDVDCSQTGDESGEMGPVLNEDALSCLVNSLQTVVLMLALS